jgi:basic membrane protein A
MRKWLFSLLAVLVIASLALTACGGEEEKDLQVGFVTDVGEVDDRSFNQASWEALQQAEEELGAEIKYIETKDSKDYEDNIRQFADEGYDIIVTSGFGLGAATAAMAAEYPDIKFIGTDQWDCADGEKPNCTGLVFREDHSGYLAGVLAARLTESGTVAAVLGTDLVPPVVAFKEGFEAGAKATKPDIKILSTYHPGGIDVAFTDPEWGAATAAQAIDQGADVVFGAGGKTGNGALEETATREGLWCIGVDVDQWETVPGAHACLVSSAMKMLTPGVFTLIKMEQDGEFPPGIFFGDAALASFHDHDGAVSQEIKDELERIAEGLKDGSIKTGYGE